MPAGVRDQEREAESGSVSAPHNNVLRPLHLCRGSRGSAAGAGEKRQERGDDCPQETSLLQQNSPWLTPPLPRVDEVETEVGKELAGNNIKDVLQRWSHSCSTELVFSCFPPSM